ncbi:MAG TPA: cellobiose phosphorylase, partial [Casimicrobiaceae bacterium]|nr:cellobiose phosphorylase [Casimicrobiaceae bacterium]
MAVNTDIRSWRTPRERDLGLRHIANKAGLGISILPNGSVFAIEHRSHNGAILVNQVLASPIDGGIGRILLRAGGANPNNIEVVGSHANVRLGVADDRVVWEGVTSGIRHRVTLRLLPDKTAWIWRVDATNESEVAVPIDAIIVQDLGLGARAFVTNNEAYASQYIDHHIARHARCGPVVMSRQNLAQGGKHPWVMHGCLDGASAFATDAMQVFGPGYRDADGIRAAEPSQGANCSPSGGSAAAKQQTWGSIPLAFGTRLADRRLQHEAACAAIQSSPSTLEPRASASWRFFALYEPDHPAASDDSDLTKLDVAWPDRDDIAFTTRSARRSLAQDAPSADVVLLSVEVVAQRYPDRFLEEFDGARRLSLFTPDRPHNRHVVLRDKERMVLRRHGALLRSGKSMLPDESTLCATCWMHGVFAAQLTIGNTSFHKLFSVSRDPYNIMRASGLRALVDTGNGWSLLTIPSAFEMGLSDCRWIYVLADRVITVRAIASGDDPAMQWRISIDGAPCRLLVYGNLVLGERDFENAGRVIADLSNRRFTFQPDPESLWGQHYPDAAYHLVTSTPNAVEAIGADELLYADRSRGSGTHVAIKTLPTREFCFAVVGSLTNAAVAARLASKYERAREDSELLDPATKFWTSVTRGSRIIGDGVETAALDASLPWLAHDAIIHLTV